jgi:hypothetical protein
MAISDENGGSRPDHSDSNLRAIPAARQRLAEALRANLGRRKAQQRARRKQGAHTTENKPQGETAESGENAGTSSAKQDST